MFLPFTAGPDYTTVSETVTLSSANPRACVNVPIIDDSFVENAEIFSVTLTTGSPLATVQLIPTATINVISDDGELTSLQYNRYIYQLYWDTMMQLLEW